MAVTPGPSGRSLRDLRNLTPARVGLGRSGASLPTEALLEFTLDHARARDAVHAAFDVPAMMQGLDDLGLPANEVTSRVHDRKEYLRRPDLGRSAPVGRVRARACTKCSKPCDDSCFRPERSCWGRGTESLRCTRGAANQGTFGPACGAKGW